MCPNGFLADAENRCHLSYGAIVHEGEGHDLGLSLWQPSNGVPDLDRSRLKGRLRRTFGAQAQQQTRLRQTSPEQ